MEVVLTTPVYMKTWFKHKKGEFQGSPKWNKYFVFKLPLVDHQVYIMFMFVF